MEARHLVRACCCGEADSALTAQSLAGSCCGVSRRFATKAEQREALEAYRTDLKKELAGLEERLAELKT